MEQHQKIHLKISEMLVEQSIAHKESRRTLSIGNISRIIAGN